MHSARIGLVVPKRVIRKAVQRNRVKRLLREAFRHRLSELPALDIVVQVLREADNRTLRTDADMLFAELSETRQSSGH